MNNRYVRLLAAVLAVLLAVTALVSLVPVPVRADGVSGSYDSDSFYVYDGNDNEVTYIAHNATVNIRFICRDDAVDNTHYDGTFVSKYGVIGSNLSFNNNWSASSRTEVQIEVFKDNEVTVTIKNLTYKSSSRANALSTPKFVATATSSSLASASSLSTAYSLNVPSHYFNRNSGGGGGSSDDDDGPYSPDIVIESVNVRGRDDIALSAVTKDTPEFTIDVIYADYGLREANTNSLSNSNAEYTTNIIDPGGFVPNRGTRGTLTNVTADSNGTPRFRATFTGMTWDGGSNSFSFRVQYYIDGWDITGNSSAYVYIARMEDEEDDDEIPPPTPYIIINNYSFGDDLIEAGASFTLSMSFQNTSTELPIENIVLTLTPTATSATEGSVPLSIASSSNTYYYGGLAAGGSISQSIDLNVKPDSSVGSAGIQIEFAYEYIVDKERKTNTTTVDIAIPITQIDRFAVDPITDYTSYITTDDEGYVTVSFVNRGKSTTYNISGYIMGPDGTPGQTEHYGNLEPGKNGTLDFSLRIFEVGEFQGNVVITYEDENNEEKELTEAFTVQVDEPWYGGYDPGPEDPGMWEEEEEKVPAWRIVLCVIGGLAIAAPIALYLLKRVQMRGSEDFDEDF